MSFVDAKDESRSVKRAMARRRAVSLGSAAALFALIFVLLPSTVSGPFRETLAFDAAALTFIAITLYSAMHGDAKLTQRRAAVEDPGRNVIFLIVILAALSGLCSAVFILGKDVNSAHNALKAFELVTGILAVVSGWVLIHLVYTLRYAHAYYYDPDGADPGGLEFPGKRPPTDYDFAYFSFVIGMTFQVSDVTISDPRIRREVLTHALISFAYNTAIIALGVNIASGLLH